jgi:hypothetical protein
MMQWIFKSLFHVSGAAQLFQGVNKFSRQFKSRELRLSVSFAQVRE